MYAGSIFACKTYNPAGTLGCHFLANWWGKQGGRWQCLSMISPDSVKLYQVVKWEEHKSVKDIIWAGPLPCHLYKYHCQKSEKNVLQFSFVCFSGCSGPFFICFSYFCGHDGKFISSTLIQVTSWTENRMSKISLFVTRHQAWSTFSHNILILIMRKQPTRQSIFGYDNDKDRKVY